MASRSPRFYRLGFRLRDGGDRDRPVYLPKFRTDIKSGGILGISN
ncbi:hypothetical protein [Kamptonema sp. UHCC 0994]|nr:hypothetical protein [Kamptonema sp. UHCC 0994]MDF0551989.1 hypothetical protein [Kamptonema sp. UHCC 0994]